MKCVRFDFFSFLFPFYNSSHSLTLAYCVLHVGHLSCNVMVFFTFPHTPLCKVNVLESTKLIFLHDLNPKEYEEKKRFWSRKKCMPVDTHVNVDLNQNCSPNFFSLGRVSRVRITCSVWITCFLSWNPSLMVPGAYKRPYIVKILIKSPFYRNFIWEATKKKNVNAFQVAYLYILVKIIAGNSIGQKCIAVISFAKSRSASHMFA